MGSKPRKQTIKFFFKDGVAREHQGKIFLAVILSNSALWKFNPSRVETVDKIVGDRANIERFGRKLWMQRNAFLYRGYVYSLQHAVERLENALQDVSFKVQKLTMPTHEKMISLHAPLKPDKIYYLGDGSRTKARRFVGPLHMAFRTEDPEKMDRFLEVCQSEKNNGELFDVWTDSEGDDRIVIAKTYRRIALRLQSLMGNIGHPVGYEAMSWLSFMELLHSFALYNK